jgi:hypothetical protein
VKWGFVAVLVAGLGLSAVEHAASEGAPAVGQAQSKSLVSGEPSIDALLERFREALSHKDKASLRALRLTQDEYIGIVLPGSVPPGQPWATYSEQAQQYFWGILNGKSVYSEAGLLNDFGGRDLKVKSVRYHKGVQDYANYRAYKQLVLTVEDDAGNVEQMRLGSIAEIAGQYKFISYVRD